MGVVHDIRLQELRMYTDYGRCCRPLYIVETSEDGPRLRIRKRDIRELQRDAFEPQARESARAMRSLACSCCVPCAGFPKGRHLRALPNG